MSKNDLLFGSEGAKAFEQDLKNIKVHLLDTEHFALDEESNAIAIIFAAFFPLSFVNASISIH